ncbi:sensor histidine kinase [Massilia sp. TWR1-2-2]|uniref:sensor histidine kinase n=1 Tax=Massilia sp. TWR1-2-2 TaxID=2804584 RepID=UPI003CF66557
MTYTTAECGSHPLDLIPLFRRWPRSHFRNIVYTGVWNTLIAVFLTGAGMMFDRHDGSFLEHFVPVWLISNVIGYMVHGTLSGLDYLLRGWPSRIKGLPTAAYHVTVISICVLLGIAIGNAVLKGLPPFHYLERATQLAPLVPFALLMALFVFLVLMSSEKRIANETLAARQSEQIAAAGQLLAEARLRGLQAQIEPHFLYNTLANVLGLIDTQPAKARHMLERFIDFLRASLTASRAEHATLGAELDLAAAYLDVLTVRLGERLRYRIEADGAARAARIAPMLLQPIVENAVMHGLEPKIDGGEIVLRALFDGAHLLIEVADTGAGISAAPPRDGGGVGLANLRSRLRSLYGAGAQLQLLENQPCGMTVRVLLPEEMVSPSTNPPP